MLSSKNLMCRLAMIIMFVISIGKNCYGIRISADLWHNFGKQVVCFRGYSHCPVPLWMSSSESILNAFGKPNSDQSAAAVEMFLEEVLAGYEQNTFAWQGRIPLDRNPHCVLGLYLAERFPETKLGDLGRRLFAQCIECSCLVVFGTEIPWKQRLETELTKIEKNFIGGFKRDFFDLAEWPFLLIYLAKNGSSGDAQQHAAKLLAKHLWEQYGLVPALTQYRLLLLGEEYADVNERTQLQVARFFEETSAITDAQKLYEKILENTNVAEIAKAAAEDLAQMKLANFQEIDAWQALDVLHKRFSNTKFKSEDLQRFFLSFQTNRRERLEQLTGELLSAESEEEVLKLCRVCNNLWTEKEALNQWQYVIDNTEPGSLAWQFGRLNLAQSLASNKKVNEAKDILSNLSSSTYPTVRARALFVSADIAESLNRTSEAVVLYQQASQIKRPTALEQWLKAYSIKQVDVKKLTAEELNFFASFLRGYNELIDGNLSSGAANLLKAKEACHSLLQKSLLYRAKKLVPEMLMLAYLKMGDYAKAEQYGLEAIRTLEENERDSKQLPNFPSQIKIVNDLLFELSGELRALPKEGSKSRLVRYAKNIYTSLTAQSPRNTDFRHTERELLQLFWQIKKQRIEQLLSAEYDLVSTQVKREETFEEFLDLEPIIFTTHLLREDSFEQIHRALAANTGQEYTKGQMYRFAKFAQKVKRPYMARMALEVAAQQIDTTHDNVQLLENIADMYSAVNNHQKAIEIYDRIVKEVSDSNVTEEVQLKIINVYAEQLKLYDRAIQESQKFLKKFPDSLQISNVEFLMGKLAYLDKDYTGATGQLDSFERKYPDSPHVGEAMMLAALSRMSDGNTQDVIDRFKGIIQKYPEGDLAVRSKFLIGYAQVSEQKYSQALETFKQLLEQFPKSEYTKQAQSFIDRLSKISK